MTGGYDGFWEKKAGMVMYRIRSLAHGCFMIQFDELLDSRYATTTNMLVIEGKRRIYICDTYLGPSFMAEVMDDLALPGWKQRIVINSHYHWDHVWGNAFFDGSLIVGHRLCHDCFLPMGMAAYESEAEFRREEFPLVPPSLVISDEIVFPEDGVTVFYSPGHTRDSISLFSRPNRVLFAGDNIEKLLPTYIENHDYPVYIGTLQRYLEVEADIFVPGHDEILERRDVEFNIRYLKNLQEGRSAQYEEEPFKKKHLTNVKD